MQTFAKPVRAGFAALLLLVTGPALAGFPDKPVKIVVPFAPGGGTDLIARTMGIAMAQELGQPVIIDNKPGAATIIGTDAVAKSAPDGYTLVMATVAHVVNPSLQSKLPYNHEKAFAPVMLVGVSPNVLVVRAESPLKSVKDLIDAAKANPGKLSFASSGNGGAPHLAGELFQNVAGIKMLHVPYRGSGPAVIDLIAGRITMMFDATPSLLPHITAGKLRPMAAASPQRHRLLPDVPSFGELGLPGMDIALWYGVVAPGGTPAPIVQRLNAELAKIVDMPDVRKTLTEQGADMQGGSAEDFGAFMRNESARWSVVVTQAGIKRE